ncbi:MAG: 23S rRNA (uracil(1939)-C(5))-methyltransferase RlmD [Bacteroidales bacterium]|nr:23S rRNA (uracil(1939)-C(5))-methyltransferase RlmD [Bacteroidales bacterium]
MARRRRSKFPKYENVEIIDLALEGKAIGKVKNINSEQGDLTIFVSKTVPGDIVDVQINKKKKNYREGYPVKFHKYSEKRTEPFCEHFGICGGCTRQQLSYDDQVHYKQKQVIETLKRIGKIELPEIMPILKAPEITFYRNKLEYTFTNSRWITQEEVDSDIEIERFKGIGFHIPGKFDKILDIEKCWLQAEPSNSIRLFIRDFAVKNNYDFFNHYKKTGFLRTLIIRTSTTGEVMIIPTFFHNDKEKMEKLLNAISEKFPEITSVNYVVNEKLNDSITDQEVLHYKGKEYITEKMDDIIFKISPKSFYQTNSEQAYNLYNVVKKFANFKGGETIYDLYTGTGTIANFIAKHVKKVIGIEYVEDSIKDAKINSEINSINNTEFYAGDMKEILTDEFISEKNKPDIMITDPPRSGMHKKVIETILNAFPEKIIYVSCNVATQARDIELLAEKYRVTKVQPVDMFPHTHHVENVVLLEKNDF